MDEVIIYFRQNYSKYRNLSTYPQKYPILSVIPHIIPVRLIFYPNLTSNLGLFFTNATANFSISLLVPCHRSLDIIGILSIL